MGTFGDQESLVKYKVKVTELISEVRFDLRGQIGPPRSDLTSEVIKPSQSNFLDDVRTDRINSKGSEFCQVVSLSLGDGVTAIILFSSLAIFQCVQSLWSKLTCGAPRQPSAPISNQHKRKRGATSLYGYMYFSYYLLQMQAGQWITCLTYHYPMIRILVRETATGIPRLDDLCCDNTNIQVDS